MVLVILDEKLFCFLIPEKGTDKNIILSQKFVRMPHLFGKRLNDYARVYF